MGIKRLRYTDIPSVLRARAAGEVQKRLQSVLADPVSTAEQRDAARRQQALLRDWTGGALQTQAEQPAIENSASPTVGV